MSDVLEIVIPGNPVSGNHAKMPIGRGRQVRTPAARDYDMRIASIALASVILAKWKMPDYVCVDVDLFNGRTDRDNACKEILDPLQGIVFAHDSRILDGRTVRLKDKGGPRVILRIRAVDGKDYGFAPPRKAAC